MSFDVPRTRVLVVVLQSPVGTVQAEKELEKAQKEAQEETEKAQKEAEKAEKKAQKESEKKDK